MTADQHPARNGESPDSPDQVLAALQDSQSTIDRAEIERLVLAVHWAVMHPVESIDQAATFDGTEGELAIAGPGAPLVAEFCVAELALALAMSTDAGQAYLGDAVELRYRLPKLWTKVLSGRVPVWKARKIAHATRTLPMAGAGHVDAHLAPVAARCSYAQIERAVDDAIRRYDPVEAERRRRQAADGRHFDLDLRQVTYDGTVRVDAELDLADALDLDHALAKGAAQLAELGNTETLDVRRSLAAGALARHELTLDLQTGTETRTTAASKRQLMIYVHLTDDAVRGGLAGVENTRSTVSVDQVKQWCQGSDTQVTVRPVIDLHDDLHTDTYRPTPVMREQAALVNPVCVFPRCTRPSRHLDLDHLEEWSDQPGHGGSTAIHNLAPACRRHHRYKTHGGWSVVRTGPTSFTWTSPHGRVYDWDTSHARHTR